MARVYREARMGQAGTVIKAAVSLPLMIPGYTAAKALGLTNARSPASLAEMVEAYKGLGEGLVNDAPPDAVAGMVNPKPRLRMGVDGTKPKPKDGAKSYPYTPSSGVRG